MDSLERSLDFLARTPQVLRALLSGLDGAWIRADDGAGYLSTSSAT